MLQCLPTIVAVELQRDTLAHEIQRLAETYTDKQDSWSLPVTDGFPDMGPRIASMTGRSAAFRHRFQWCAKHSGLRIDAFRRSVNPTSVSRSQCHRYHFKGSNRLLHSSFETSMYGRHADRVDRTSRDTVLANFHSVHC